MSIRAKGFSIILSIGFLFAVLYFARYTLQSVYEFAHFTVHPTVQGSIEYGDRHFSALKDGVYDVDLAAYYFTQAKQLGSTDPYLYHQLARIQFLKGHFTQALSDINTQIMLHGTSTPNSYYVRGLIEGFMGQYAAAAEDYKTYLSYDPTNWAALNDYAWVLLRWGKSSDALDVTAVGLQLYPDNPWLLNSNAIARVEVGDYSGAYMQIQHAQRMVTMLTESDWLLAYPGNDPRIAPQGLASFRASLTQNTKYIKTLINE